MRSARTTTSGSSPSSPPSPLSCSRRATTSGQRLLRNKLDNFRYFLKLVVAIQEQNNHDWWSISWRFCTISPTQLPSLYDLRHSTTCVRSQIWWLQFNCNHLWTESTKSNFPVWACSGGLQQGAQGGAWLRRIPGDKDGHFWMWALTLETKDWVAWSCVCLCLDHVSCVEWN